MVRVFKAYPAGTGRPLTTYVLAAKHEQGERLGPYIRDPTKDKIEWSRTVNAGVADPLQAIGAIERYNAQNTRKHSISRWEHIVISFAEGERPVRKQMEIIEDRLMEAIGFGDHPRISAAHHDTLHSHLHIAVSRIDPKTLKAAHPRHSRFTLQAEAARLEIDLGLRQERKTLLSRERREIDERAALDRALSAHHQRLDPDNDFSLESEMRGYFDSLGRRGAEAAEAAGVTREAIVSGLVGVARIRPAGALWEPDAQGTAVFVTPVRVERAETPYDVASPDPKRAVRTGEIVDIVAWHPSRPDQWVLRTGEAIALGAVQYRLSDEPGADLNVRPSPLEWLRHGADGVVLLTSDPVERRLILGRDEERIVSQEQTRTNMAMSEKSLSTLRHLQRVTHAFAHDREEPTAPHRERGDTQNRGSQRGRATPGDALYARYKTERAIALGARQQAEQAVYDRFAGHQQQLSSFYNVQHEKQKLVVQRGSERHKEHQVLSAAHRGDRAEANRQRGQQLAAARRDHPLPTWDQFLERESQRGDREATRLLQNRQERGKQQGLER